VELLRAAAVPNNQSSTLFAVIGAVVGLLFAFNAMLLTTPARRRNLAALRLEGADRPRALQMMAFEALALGVLASGLGLLLGEELSRQLFREPPKYLTSAFPVGTQRVVPLGVAVGAFAAGVLATLLAASRPALDLFSRRPIDSIYHDAERPTEGISPRLARSMLLVGLGLIGVVVLVILTIPAIGVTGGGLLAICMLLMCPAIVVWALGFLDWLTFRLRRPRLLAIASIELRAAPTRVIALSATAAVAMFGILTIQGGQHDLLRGIAAAQRSFNRTANLWIVPGGQENAYATELFSTGPETTLITIIRHVPGVSAVRVYQSSFRDLEGRRVWVIARPSGDRPLIQSATLREGNLQLAERELRAGGWVVLSSKLAEDRSLHIGEPVRLTTPAGERSFDLAATVASLWPSGTILMNPADYRSAWESVTPTALEVDLKPGIHLAVARVAVAKALSHYGGLRVQTSAERQSEQNSVARQGPKQITEIGDLLVIVAALALGAAIAASLWERRPRFAALKIYGCDARQIWVLLTIETAAILIIGCMIGAIFGFCGQAFATLWVKHISGFPVIYRPAGPLALQTLAAITILGTAVVALPGRAVARVAPKLGFHE
jgi:putative ABC transport system permease protein